MQASSRPVPLHHFLQTGLVDGHAALVEQVDLGTIEVEAKHVVSHFGQAGSRNQSHVPRAND
ncbi:MAG: hypothetical protein JW395_1866 [Nitrospira sp.]|nr:hypothetical protein [Nitrospira sp.]